MDGTFLISSLGTMIVTAAALVLLLKRAYIPAIVTYIVVGLIIVPLLHWVLPYLARQELLLPEAAVLPETIGMIGEIGVALLLFIVGLELNLEKIRDVGKVAIYAGIGQVVFTAAGGFILCRLLGFEVIEGIFVAVALTFSSTVIVVKLLDQKNELNSLYGRIAIGIFLVQDLVVILVLTFLAGLGNPETLRPETIAKSVAKAFLGMGLMLALSILTSRYFLAKPFNWASRSAETLFIWALGWCFLYVVLARAMNLSPELGAFLAGISLAQLSSSHDLRHRIHPLMSFFVAVFFISLGAQMELQAARQHLLPAIWLSIFVLVGNPLIFMWIIARCGYSEKTSFLASVTVAQISEFSFVFAGVGLSSGLIDKSILALIALVGLITFVLSSYMILYNHQLYGWAKRWGFLTPFRAGAVLDEPAPPSLSNHVILVGLNTMGRKIARGLAEQGQSVVAIDQDPEKLERIPGKKIVGSVEYLPVTEEAHLSTASLAVSCLKIEDVSNVLAFRCKQLGVPAAIHIVDRSALEDITELGVRFVIDSKRFGVGATIRAIEPPAPRKMILGTANRPRFSPSRE